MLSAKIKDEPVNQMVSCKSSFAFEERDEERRCRELETFRYRAPMCLAGAMGWRQRGHPREQQVGLFGIGVGFTHSSAGGGMECTGKSGRCQGSKPSLLTLHLRKHRPCVSTLVALAKKWCEAR